MSIQQLNNLNLKAGLEADGDVGSAGQVLSSTGPNGIEWINQLTLSSGSAERTEILVKNLEGSALSKGDPVYIIGSVGASDRLEVGCADAGDAAKMPCVGLLTQDLAINGEGTAIVTGKLKNLITSPIDGATPTENDTIYVKSGGGLTLTKPTGSTNLIQNVGQVGRVSTSADGNIVVSAILRSNDVPNLPTGRIWVGDSNTTTSGVVYLNETTNQLGINTTTTDGTISIESPVGAGFGLYTKTAGINNWSGLYQDGSSNWTSVLRNGSGTQTVQLNSNGDSYLNGGDVGIATTSPEAILHINGTNDTTYWGPLIKSTSANPARLTFTNTEGSGFIDQNDNALRFYHNSAYRMYINSSGNVGIGTTSPSDRLEVAAANSQLRLTDTDDSKFTQFSYSSGKLVVRNNSTTTTTNQFTLDAAGQMGIGTTSPGHKLDVDGYIAADRYVDTDNSSFYLEPNSGATGQWKVQTPSGYISIGPNNSSYCHFYTDRSSYYFDKKIVVDTGVIASYNEDLTFQAPQNSTRMVINSSTGNVGIGTSSPDSKLQISGSGTQRLRITSTDGANADLSCDGVSSMTLGSPNGIPIRFVTSNAERMRITSSGNVGIGTTAPNRDLVVSDATNAHLKILSYTAVAEAQLTFATISSDTLYEKSAIIASGSGSWGRHNMHFCVNNAASSANVTLSDSRMMIDYATGNVGIGTTSPSQKLQVAGSILANGAVYSGSTTHGFVSYFGNTDIQTSSGGSVLVRNALTYRPIQASAFTVSSDYRLKSNITPLENAIDRLNQLNVHRFNWNDRLDEPKVDGFIAHEVSPIIPEAVLGEKDEVYEDGTPKHQGIDQAKIVPLLTAALQEAILKIEQLETRIQTLENN